jgi:hypothetical protein
MGALIQALEIIFEVQMKRSNEKVTRKISFQTYKMHFFFSSSLWTSLIFKPHKFLIFIHIEQYKVPPESFTNYL